MSSVTGSFSGTMTSFLAFLVVYTTYPVSQHVEGELRDAETDSVVVHFPGHYPSPQLFDHAQLHIGSHEQIHVIINILRGMINNYVQDLMLQSVG